MNSQVISDKLQELVTLIQVDMRELADSQAKLDAINAQIEGQNNVIVKNNEIIEQLHLGISSMQECFKKDKDFVDSQKTLLAAKISQQENILVETNSVKELLLKQQAELETLMANAKDKYQEGINKLELAKNVLKEAKQLSKDTQARIESSDIINREEHINSREKVADDKMNAAIAMQEENNEMKAELGQLSHDLINQKIVLDIKTKQSNALEASLKEQQAQIESDKADTISRKQELDTQELRLNKLIKEKNLQGILSV